MALDLEHLRELMLAMAAHDVTDLELEDEKVRVQLRRGPAGGGHAIVAGHAPTPVTVLPPAPSPTGGSASSVPSADAKAADADADAVFVTSPLVGTFYRAPSPEAAAFAKVGDTIKRGQALCIVEAMKLMNEIEAEFACTILEVLVENGRPVEFGDRLFRVRKV